MSSEEYQRTGQRWLNEVFAEADPTNPVFAEGVEQKAIVYAGAPLSIEQLRIVADAAAQVADEELYLTTLEHRIEFISATGLRVRDRDLMSITENWLLAHRDLDEYEEIQFVKAGLDHALHSHRGQWAMLVSHEGHTVVGGRFAFVEPLLDCLPIEPELAADARSSVGSWLRDMRDLDASLGHPEGTDWVPRLAIRVYGFECGSKLLRANGWADFVK